MKTVIIAPHPDDEWIGCGCTMLKKIDGKEHLKVLVITRAPHSENRIKVSRTLAKKYGYDIEFLDEPEKNIKDFRLVSFLKKNIGRNDLLYIPDFDLHPDHRMISSLVIGNFSNKMQQYCVYNNSRNIFTKILNKVMAIFTGNALSSFRKGTYDKIFGYKLDEKNSNITEFGEVKRGGDVLRSLHHMS